ncbi:threonine synthase-like 2 isoform X2 [Lithobates pipiens]
MKYTSTRGAGSGVGFEEVLFSGFAADDGLYMPEQIPKLDEQTLRSWSSLSYKELVKEVCSLFIPSELIPRNDLHGLIDKALLRFRHPDIVPITRLENGLNVMEMWHGPTYAFKDLAMSCVGQFLDYFLKKNNRHVNILVATSGDTGSAAIEGVRENPNIDIIVLYPIGRCTKIQELQMITVFEDNVHLLGAGCIAQKMGLPIQLVAAVNKNDIIHRAVQHGDFTLGDTEKTLASAMDIQEPYNVERILWLIADGDSGTIKAMMEEFNAKKQLRLPAELHKKLQGMMTSCSIKDEDIIRTIKRCWEENHYQLCPHSAVGVFYHYQQTDSNQNKPRCCLAPASAAKFPEVILQADLTPDPPADIQALWNKNCSYLHVPRDNDWEETLREKIEIIDS